MNYYELEKLNCTSSDPKNQNECKNNKRLVKLNNRLTNESMEVILEVPFLITYFFNMITV